MTLGLIIRKVRNLFTLTHKYREIIQCDVQCFSSGRVLIKALGSVQKQFHSRKNLLHNDFFLVVLEKSDGYQSLIAIEYFMTFLEVGLEFVKSSTLNRDGCVTKMAGDTARGGRSCEHLNCVVLTRLTCRDTKRF